MRDLDNTLNIPLSLKSETKFIGLSGLGLLIVFTGFFHLFCLLGKRYNGLFKLGLCGCWPFACLLRGQLHLNRPQQHAGIYHNLGWANRLTIFRGFLIAFSGGFIFLIDLNEKVLLIPAFSYLIAAIIDRVDGYIARLTKHESLLASSLIQNLMHLAYY